MTNYKSLKPTRKSMKEWKKDIDDSLDKEFPKSKGKQGGRKWVLSIKEKK